MQRGGQPRRAFALHLAENLAARVGEGDQHLAPVARVRGARHVSGFFQRRDRAGHRRGLDPLVLGELAGGHRSGALQGGEHAKLRLGEVGGGLGFGAQPARRAVDGHAHDRGEVILLRAVGHADDHVGQGGFGVNKFGTLGHRAFASKSLFGNTLSLAHYLG